MVPTFAAQLRHHLDTVDVVTDHLADVVTRKLHSYFENLDGLRFFTVHRLHSSAQEGAVLETDQDLLWPRQSRHRANSRMKDNEGRTYLDQVSYALGENQNLWLFGLEEDVDLENGVVGQPINQIAGFVPLRSAAQYVNVWAGEEARMVPELPKYVASHDAETRTSVIIVGPDDGTVADNRAVANFEFDGPVKHPLKSLKDELRTLAQIAFALGDRRQVSKRERKTTARALSSVSVDRPESAQQLLLLAQTSDVVDQVVKARYEDLIQRYLDALGIDFWVLFRPQLVRGRADDVDVFEKELHPRAKADTWQGAGVGSHSLTADDGLCTSQVARAFYVNRPTVITSVNDGELLDSAEGYLDHHPAARESDPEIPRYIRNSARESRISMIFPVSVGPAAEYGETTGVVNFESAEAKPSRGDSWLDHADDLQSIATAIARTNYLDDVCTASRRKTEEVLEGLEVFVDGRLRSSRSIFIAYPKNHSSDVVDAILDAVEKLEQANPMNSFDNRTWEERARVGNAVDTLWEELQSSDLIIAYLSERIDGGGTSGGPTYRDSANIVAECAWGLADSRREGRDKVLLLREKDSDGELIFDLRSEQRIDVGRRDNGNIQDGDLCQSILELAERALELH